MASMERYLAEKRKQDSVSMAPWETKAIEKIRELEAENAQLRKALEFYADFNSYARCADAIRTDFGRIAREALAWRNTTRK